MGAGNGLVYIKLYVDDMLAMIAHNGEPTDATGARLRLWLAASREEPCGTLPKEVKKLCTWAGVRPSRWRVIGPLITAGWEDAGERWVVRRIVEQHGQRVAVTAVRRAAGMASVKARIAAQAARGRATNAQQLLSTCSANGCTNTNTNKKEKPGQPATDAGRQALQTIRKKLEGDKHERRKV